MIIVRELTGGLYFGERQTIEENGGMTATATILSRTRPSLLPP